MLVWFPGALRSIREISKGYQNLIGWIIIMIRDTNIILFLANSVYLTWFNEKKVTKLLSIKLY